MKIQRFWELFSCQDIIQYVLVKQIIENFLFSVEEVKHTSNTGWKEKMQGNLSKLQTKCQHNVSNIWQNCSQLYCLLRLLPVVFQELYTLIKTVIGWKEQTGLCYCPITFDLIEKHLSRKVWTNWKMAKFQSLQICKMYTLFHLLIFQFVACYYTYSWYLMFYIK